MASKKKSKKKRQIPKGSSNSLSVQPTGMLRPADPLPFIFRLALIMVFGLVFFFALRQVSSLDVGFHLRAGNYILEKHDWPKADPFSFTYPEHPYIDSQWGYQVILAVIEKIGGSVGVVFFHTVLVLVCFYFLYRTVRIWPVDPVSLVVLFFLSAAAMEFRFIVRPELMSWLFLSIVLYILHRHAEGFDPPLWVLPLILLLWVNCHSGFVLGWLAIGCFFIGLSINRRRLDTKLLMWGIVSVIITIVNPYHFRGVLFPFKLLAVMRASSLFSQNITELISPFTVGDQLTLQFPFYPYTVLVPFFILFGLSFIAALRLFFERKYWSVILFLPFFYLSAKMMRGIPFLIVACLPLIVYGTPLCEGLRFFRLRKRYRQISIMLISILIVITIGMEASIVTNAYYLSTRRLERFGWEWNRNVLPVEAMNYVNRAGIKGPVLNHLNFGGWLMWATGQRTFIDGRLEVAGEEFYKEYEHCLRPRPDKQQWRRELEKCVTHWKICWIIFPYGLNPELLVLLSRDSAWRLAYVDYKAVIFVRSHSGTERYIDPGLDQTLTPPAVPRPESLSLPGLFGDHRQGAFARFLTGLIRRQNFPMRDHMLGLFHYFRGEWPKAYAHFAKAIEESQGRYYEIYNNLGSVLFRLGQFKAAEQCYKIVLKENPRHPIALRRLRQIREKNF